MRRRSGITFLAIGLLVGACGGSDAPVGQAEDVLPASGLVEVEHTESVPGRVAPDTETTTPDDTVRRPSMIELAAAVSEEDLTVFIAAVERAVEGTDQEGVVFDDPEIYIGLAQTSCARLSDGEDFDAIATDLLGDLSTDDADDEPRLIGAIVGAATQTICPEHAGSI